MEENKRKEAFFKVVHHQMGCGEYYYSDFCFIDYDGSLLPVKMEDINRGFIRPGRILYLTGSNPVSEYHLRFVPNESNKYVVSEIIYKEFN